jgi:hypothetical protein
LLQQTKAAYQGTFNAAKQTIDSYAQNAERFGLKREDVVLPKWDELAKTPIYSPVGAIAGNAAPGIPGAAPAAPAAGATPVKNIPGAPPGYWDGKFYHYSNPADAQAARQSTAQRAAPAAPPATVNWKEPLVTPKKATSWADLQQAP